MNCSKTSKIAVTLIISKQGVISCSPFKPTNGEIIPPNINWNKPSKLEALPLPPVRSSIAIEKPNGAIEVTGEILMKNAMSNTYKGRCKANVAISNITPTICTIVK